YVSPRLILSYYFFFDDTSTTQLYTLSLHDALPISSSAIRCSSSSSSPPSYRSLISTSSVCSGRPTRPWQYAIARLMSVPPPSWRSEEHTSELQSRENLVCRLLLEKKKTQH